MLAELETSTLAITTITRSILAKCGSAIATKHRHLTGHNFAILMAEATRLETLQTRTGIG